MSAYAAVIAEGQAGATSGSDLTTELAALRSGMALFRRLPEIAASAVPKGDIEALAREGLIALGAAVPFACGTVLSIHGDRAVTLWAGDSAGTAAANGQCDMALDDLSPVYRRVIHSRRATVLQKAGAVRRGSALLTAAGVGAVAVYPARSATGVPGLVLIGRRAGDPFLPFERTVLDGFADWLGAALHEARRLAVERLYASLTSDTRVLATEPNLFAFLAERVQALMPWDGVGVGQIEGGRLIWRAGYDLELAEGGATPGVVWPASGHVRRLLEAGELVWGKASDFSLPLALTASGAAPGLLVLAPFHRQGRLLGVVVMAREGERAFTAGDLLFAESVGHEAARMARIEYGLTMARDQLERGRLLDAFSLDLLSSVSYRDRFHTIARWLPRLVPAASVALYRRNPETGRLSLYDRIQVSAVGRGDVALPVNLDGLMEHLRRGEDVVELPPGWHRGGGRGAEAALLIPLEDGDALIAALLVFMQRGRAPTPEHLAALQDLAQFARLPLRNSQLFETVETGKRDWEQAFDTIPDSFALLSPDRVVRRINRALAEERGAQPRDYVGLRCHEVLCEQDEPCVGCPLPEALITQTATTSEVHNLRTGQTYSVQAFPIMNEQGKVVSVVEIARNVTVSRRLQEQLVQSERLRALGEMASGVAHHFKNILATVLGQAEVLLHQSSDPHLRHSLQVISQAALDGATTVQRIQTSTRAGHERPFVLTDVNQVVREALDAAAPLQKADAAKPAAGIEVETRLGHAEPVWASPPDLREALINLITNARDAMPQGGRVRVTTWSEGPEVFASISDTGVGMDEETRLRVFDPFFSTKGDQGAGLGLSIVYGIVRRHQGEIGVESAPGRGTTVTLRLPAAQAGREEPVQPQEAQPQRGWRALVVEDNERLREVLERMLTLDSHEVVSTTDGLAALRVLQERRFDVVFTDLKMPKVSGWQIAAAAKALAPAPFVVVVTGMDADVEEEPVGAVADVVLAKPFTLASLRETIARLADRRAAA